jgi:type I restriction enzyme S subunit
MSETMAKNGWHSVRFDEMAMMVNDRIDDPSQANVDYYVGLEHLDSDSLAIRRWGVPTDVEATKLRFRTGDIIFGRRRVYQRKLGVARFDGICSAHAMVLRAKPDVALPEFLPFFMQSEVFMERAKEISVGSLSPTINWTALAREEFAVPSREDQRPIARALLSANQVSDTLLAVLDAATKVHAASLSILESQCEPVQLGSLLSTIIPGTSLSGSDSPPSEAEYGVLKVSAVDPHRFLPQESKTLLHQEEFIQDLSVRSGDLLMTRANTPELVGEVCLVGRDHPNLMLCDKTLRLDPKPMVDAYLLWEILQSADVRRQLKAVATGTGRSMKNISQDKIKALLVAYPDHRNVAQEVAERLRQSRTAIRAASKRVDEVRRLTVVLREGLLRPGIAP